MDRSSHPVRSFKSVVGRRERQLSKLPLPARPAKPMLGTSEALDVMYLRQGNAILAAIRAQGCREPKPKPWVTRVPVPIRPARPMGYKSQFAGLPVPRTVRRPGGILKLTGDSAAPKKKVHFRVGISNNPPAVVQRTWTVRRDPYKACPQYTGQNQSD